MQLGVVRVGDREAQAAEQLWATNYTENLLSKPSWNLLKISFIFKKALQILIYNHLILNEKPRASRGWRN